MSGERPKLERCISTTVDIPRPALDNEEAPRSPEQSQVQDHEEQEEPPIIAPSKQTALELADEMIADCERSLLNMNNIVRGMATDEFQSKRLMECSFELYQIHRQTLDRDLANIFAIARTAAKYAER